MNIGLGLVFIPLSIVFTFLGIVSIKQNDKRIGKMLIGVGIFIFSICILLIFGIYDPYSNHLR